MCNYFLQMVWLNRLQTEQQRYKQRAIHLNGFADSYGDCIQEAIPPTYLSITAWNTYREKGSSSVGTSPSRLSPSSQFPENSGITTPSSSSSSTPRNATAGGIHPAAAGPEAAAAAGCVDLPSLPRVRANSDLSHSDGKAYFAKATERALQRKADWLSEGAGDAVHRRRPSSAETSTAAPGDAAAGPDAGRGGGGRPSSCHSKRRIQLKAIREKSLSVDLPTAVVVPISRYH